MLCYVMCEKKKKIVDNKKTKKKSKCSAFHLLCDINIRLQESYKKHFFFFIHLCICLFIYLFSLIKHYVVNFCGFIIWSPDLMNNILLIILLSL